MTINELNSSAMPSSEDVDLNKAVCEYCQRLYESLVGEFERLEVKARFYLTVLTIVIGGLFLKLDMYSELFQVIKSQNIALQALMYTEILVLAASTIAAVIYVLEATRIRKWRYEFRRSPYDILISTGHASQTSLQDFYRDLAKRYLLAWDHNHKEIEKKSKATSGATRSLSVAVITLFALILTFAPVLATTK